MHESLENGSDSIEEIHTASVRRLSRAQRRRPLFLLLTLGLILILQELLLRIVVIIPEVDNFNSVPIAALLYPEQERSQFNDACRAITIDASDPDGFEFENTINLYGFRGRDFSIKRQQGVARVAFVGDSYTEGIGAPDDGTIPVWFEGFFPEQPLEAINLGIRGISVQVILQLLTESLPLLKPDVTFIVLCWNDFPTSPRHSFELQPRTATQHSVFRPRVVDIVQRLAAGKCLPLFFHRRQLGSDVQSDLELPDDLDPKVADAIRRGRCIFFAPDGLDVVKGALSFDFTKPDSGDYVGLKEYIPEMLKICERHGTQPVLVFIPSHLVVNPDYQEAYNRIRDRPPRERIDWRAPEKRNQQNHLQEVAADNDLPFIDCTDDFIEREANGERLYWPIDTHCNSAGYRAVAELCAEWYREHILSKSD